MPLQKIYCPSCRKSFFAAFSEPNECSCGNCGTPLTVGIDGRISLKQSKQIARSLGNAPVRQPIAVRDQPVASRANPPELPASGLFAIFSARWDTIRKFVPVIVTVLGSIIFSVLVLAWGPSPPPPTPAALDTSSTLIRARRLKAKTTEPIKPADRRPAPPAEFGHSADGPTTSQPSASRPTGTADSEGQPGASKKGGTGGTIDDRQEKKAGSADSSTSLDVFDRVKISVAQIKTPSATGSGFVAEPGLLVTNYHVICDSNPEELVAVLPDHPTHSNTEFKLHLIAEDTLNDIAVLAVDKRLEPLHVPPAYELRKGEEITVVGSPGTFGNQNLLNFPTDGRMGGEFRHPGSDGSCWSLSLPVNDGNSGGPVVARYTGAVLGVVTSKAVGGSLEAQSFAAPHSALIQILDDARDASPEARQAANSIHAVRKAAFSLEKFARELRRIGQTVVERAKKLSGSGTPSLQAYLTEGKFELEKSRYQIDSNQATCAASLNKIFSISQHAVEVETLRQCHQHLERALEMLRHRPNEHSLNAMQRAIWGALNHAEELYKEAMEKLNVACYRNQQPVR